MLFEQLDTSVVGSLDELETVKSMGSSIVINLTPLSEFTDVLARY